MHQRAFFLLLIQIMRYGLVGTLAPLAHAFLGRLAAPVFSALLLPVANFLSTKFHVFQKP